MILRTSLRNIVFIKTNIVKNILGKLIGIGQSVEIVHFAILIGKYRGVQLCEMYVLQFGMRENREQND